MLPPKELAHSSAQLYRDVLLTVLRYDDLLTPAEAVAAAEEAVTDYRSRFGPAEQPDDPGPPLAEALAAWETAHCEPSEPLPPSAVLEGRVSGASEGRVYVRLTGGGLLNLGRSYFHFGKSNPRELDPVEVVTNEKGAPLVVRPRRTPFVAPELNDELAAEVRKPVFAETSRGVTFGTTKVELAEDNDPTVLASLGLTHAPEAPPAFPHHAPPHDAGKPKTPRLSDVLDVGPQLFALLREDGFERPDDLRDYLDYLTQVLADRRTLTELNANARGILRDFTGNTGHIVDAALGAAHLHLKHVAEVKGRAELFGGWAAALRRREESRDDRTAFNEGKAWAYECAAEAFRGLLQASAQPDASGDPTTVHVVEGADGEPTVSASFGELHVEATRARDLVPGDAARRSTGGESFIVLRAQVSEGGKYTLQVLTPGDYAGERTIYLRSDELCTLLCLGLDTCMCAIAAAQSRGQTIAAHALVIKAAALINEGAS